MTIRVLLALCLLAAAPAAAGATPDEAPAGLSGRALADVDDARRALLQAEGSVQGVQADLTAAKPGLQIVKKDQQAAKLSHQARSLGVRAAESGQGEAAVDEASLQRGEAEVGIRFRKARVDAAKTELALRKQELTHARQVVALRQTELERDKLDTLADSSGDAAVDTQLGKASSRVAKLRAAAEKQQTRIDELADKLGAQQTEAAALQERAQASRANAERDRLLDQLAALTAVARDAEDLRVRLAEEGNARAYSDALRLGSELNLERLRLLLAENRIADPTLPAGGSEPTAQTEDRAHDAP